jgi:LysM repeat protein
MNPRRLVLYLFLNAVVSALVAFGALWLWDQTHSAAPLPLVNPTDAAATVFPVVGTVEPTTAPTAAPDVVLPTPTVYVVKLGDTLGSIAQRFEVTLEALMAANDITNPNVLSVGQSLIIPVAGSVPPTAEPATPSLLPTNVVEPPRPTATRDPNQPAPALSIREASGIGQLADEFLMIVNAGGPVDLAGWTLRDETGHLYTFPTLALNQGASVNLHTAAGTDSAADLYWAQTSAVWAKGKSVLLTDSGGTLHSRFTIP